MQRFSKVSGIAALLLSGLFVAFVFLLAVVLPQQGLGPGGLDDPTAGIPFVSISPLPTIINLIYLGIALAFIMIMLGLYERLQPLAPAVMVTVVIAGVIASTLFLTYAMLNFVATPKIVSLSATNVKMSEIVYVALRVTANAMSAGGLFAAGSALFLTSWAALKYDGLPKMLSVLMGFAAVSMILSFASLSIGLLGVILAPLWSVWLGVILLRTPATVSVSNLRIEGA